MKVHLVPEAKPRDTNMPSGIISISQFKIDIVSTLAKPRDANNISYYFYSSNVPIID